MTVVSLTATLVLVTAFSAFAQTPVTSPPTPLSQLLAEAGANNPQISAADHGARAARQVAPQVTTLPDPKFIVTEDLIDNPLQRTSEELLAMVRQNNPQVQVDASSIRKQDAQLASAKREGKPDFEVGYIYQNTDRKYRDYYMFTFDVRFPRKTRVNAEIAEATEKRSESQQTLNAHLQQQLAGVQEGWDRGCGCRCSKTRGLAVTL
jgi:outer membrane protein TolC